jgi:hypothetical protein
MTRVAALHLLETAKKRLNHAMFARIALREGEVGCDPSMLTPAP